MVPSQLEAALQSCPRLQMLAVKLVALSGKWQAVLLMEVRLYMAAMEQGAIIQVMVVLAFSR